MNKELKETLAFIVNLNSQILENQVNAINGNLTNKGLEKSQILVRDCVEVINKLSAEKDAKQNTDNPEVNKIFNHWNSKECFTTHTKLAGNLTSIRSVIKIIKDVDVICKAIDNYEEVYLSVNHWYSIRLPLNKFLNYKINEFTDKVDPINSPQSIFLKGRYGIKSNQPTIISDEEAIRSFSS